MSVNGDCFSINLAALTETVESQKAANHTMSAGC